MYFLTSIVIQEAVNNYIWVYLVYFLMHPATAEDLK